MSPRTVPSALPHPDNAPLVTLPELHALHARRAAQADAIAERVSRLVNCGLSYPDAAAVARRPARHSRLLRRPVSRAA